MKLHRLMATLVLCLVPFGATAQKKDWEKSLAEFQANSRTCNGAHSSAPPSPAEQIAACTRVLDSYWLGRRESKHDNVGRRYAHFYSMRAQAYTRLAQSQNRSGDRAQAKASYDRAIADYTTIISRHAQDLGPQLTAQVRQTRGNTYAMKGDFDRAIGEYSEAMKTPDMRRPDVAMLYTLRDEAFRQKGNYDAAIADHAKAIELAPHETHDVAMAHTRYNAGQHRQAVQSAQRALTRNDLYAPAVNVLAHALVALGAREQALLQFERAMLLGGGAQIQRFQLALARHGYQVERSGRYDPATYKALKACVEAGCRLLE